jgi:putative PIN family toxin of toxin-antitoxin system
MAGAVRVVLDTNVLLSVFVFADSRYLSIRERLSVGAWLALGNARCLDEYERVLAYPEFGLDEAARRIAFDAYATQMVKVDVVAVAASPLPSCRDPDDQKFLELARDGAADWLVTSDKALLKLGRRNQLRGLFRILTPDASVADDDGLRRPSRPPARSTGESGSNPKA